MIQFNSRRSLTLSSLAAVAFGFLVQTPVRAAESIEPVRAPSVTPYGVAGMSNVFSAEAVGQGRLNLHVRGNFYQQDRATVGTPPLDAQITTLSGGVAAGLNEYLDAFAALNIYNLRATNGDGSGFGSSIIGAQMNIPFSRDVPIRVSGQLAAIFGTAKSQINTNGLDGYNYLETRTGNDVMARVAQSWLALNDEGRGFKLHLNEGIISSLESGKDISLLTGAGVEIIPIASLIIGAEINSRTFLKDVTPTDPLWVTPQVTWRTPAYVNINVGADISLSQERDGNVTRGLEPWRGFAGVTYSLDTKSAEKREARAKARQDSLERLALSNQARRAESRTDSVTLAAAEAAARQKALADSMARKAYQDSLALLAAGKSLEEERAKRSDMEKQLLTTGLLVMDAVYFETGKTDISINSEPYLTLIAKMLTKYPKLQVEIGGHTDNVGGQKYNQNLSQGRSAAVVSYMVGVAPELGGRLTSRGYAFSQPKAPNTTAEGRQLNRRTELKVLNRDALQEYK